VLYLTGTTEVLAGKDASDLIAHTNLAVKIRVDAVRFISEGLGFRGQEGERSPYNPPVRFLSSESKNAVAKNNKQVMAKLIDKKLITPTIGRFRFHIADPEKASKWKPGQYVALSFEDELDIGYSHMRDDDPKSLNDDFLRTFTVSSRQDVLDGHDQFEITIRRVGPVTDFLFRHNVRSELQVPLQGFGGEFFIQQGEGEKVSFIAGGVGITPLLAQIYDLDLKRLNFYWTLRANDLAFANEIFERFPGLAESTKLFVTGKKPEMTDAWKKLTLSGATLERRRLDKDDITGDTADRWYMCAGPSLKNNVLGWMSGKTVTYEDFNY
jgi:ferredoxin-NADP reductase